jgi:hypothetical protein
VRDKEQQRQPEYSLLEHHDCDCNLNGRRSTRLPLHARQLPWRPAPSEKGRKIEKKRKEKKRKRR